MLSELFSIEKIYGFCQKVCYFLVINLLFLVSNLPVLLFFLLVGIKQVGTYLPLFMLCLLPFPPAFAAVLYTMGRIVRGTECGSLRDYKKGYCMDFLQKFKIGAFQLLLIFILWSDVKFFSEGLHSTVLTILFAVLFGFSIVITPNLYLLASRYQMTGRQIVKSACILTITRPVFTLGNVAALGVILMLMEISAGTTVLFMVSVYGFLVAFISKRMLSSLEEEQKN